MSRRADNMVVGRINLAHQEIGGLKYEIGELQRAQFVGSVAVTLLALALVIHLSRGVFK